MQSWASHGVRRWASDVPSGGCSRFDFSTKLNRHPDRLQAALKKDGVAALSVVYLDINSDICNHCCGFCDGFYRTLRKRQFPIQRLRKLVDEMAELGVISTVIAGDRGEPLLHPNFPEIMRRLVDNDIAVGVYTNGSTLTKAAIKELSNAHFIRFSADAGSAETHRLMHVYPEKRKDFVELKANVARMSQELEDVGVSFILDPLNVHEIALAADVFLSLGAVFIEIKPKYLPGYALDSAWLNENAETIRRQVAASMQSWGDRVVVNNQLEAMILDNVPAKPLSVAPRRCLTSMLRLVISTHGCYTCTPYRGEAERKVGDIMTQSLAEIADSAARLAMVEKPCQRRCAYHDQNDYLLGLEERGSGAEPASAPTQGDFGDRQERFL